MFSGCQLRERQSACHAIDSHDARLPAPCTASGDARRFAKGQLGRLRTCSVYPTSALSLCFSFVLNWLAFHFVCRMVWYWRRDSSSVYTLPQADRARLVPALLDNAEVLLMPTMQAELKKQLGAMGELGAKFVSMMYRALSQQSRISALNELIVVDAFGEAELQHLIKYLVRVAPSSLQHAQQQSGGTTSEVPKLVKRRLKVGPTSPRTPTPLPPAAPAQTPNPRRLLPPPDPSSSPACPTSSLPRPYPCHPSPS